MSKIELNDTERDILRKILPEIQEELSAGDIATAFAKLYQIYETESLYCSIFLKLLAAMGTPIAQAFEKMEGIPHAMFIRCDWLESFDIPEHIKFIGNMAFRECVNLKHLYIPESCEQLGWNAFQGCTNVVLQIPEKLYRHYRWHEVGFEPSSKIERY